MDSNLHKKLFENCAERQWTEKAVPWYNRGTITEEEKKIKVERMLYRRYKTSYNDCQTVPGSYDKAGKTIEVILPDGRVKPSGVRGQSYKYFTFHGTRADGTAATTSVKATCMDNAIKRLSKNVKWDI